MVRQRLFGSDRPFCDWLRKQDSLPSDGNTLGFVATDVDTFIHRYKTQVGTRGTRNIQAMMFVEVKTRGGCVPSSQLDTWSKQNQFAGIINFNGSFIRHWGVSFCFLSGTTPDDSERITWGRFDDTGVQLRCHPTSKEQLLELMRFELHPDYLFPCTPLGFQPITERPKK